MTVSLRPSIESDLEVFFLNQTDEEANQMAAFTPEDPSDKEAYFTKWTRLMKDDSIHMQTIIQNEKVVGCVVKFEIEGDAEITYATTKEYWNQGITTEAVKQFLQLEKARPLHGRVAFDNIGSQRILEKAGFEKNRKEKGYANARGKEIEEYVYILNH